MWVEYEGNRGVEWSGVEGGVGKGKEGGRGEEVINWGRGERAWCCRVEIDSFVVVQDYGLQ